MSKNHCGRSILDPIGKERFSGPFLDGLRIIDCEVCGFVHVDPYPGDEYLKNYYAGYEMGVDQPNLDDLAAIAAENAALDGLVVDLGCGDGRLMEALAARGFQNILGVDAGKMFDTARARLTHLAFKEDNAIDFLRREIGAGRQAACVVLVDVIEHLPEPHDVLGLLKNYVRPGGHLIIQVPNDFNELQMAYLRKSKRPPWFVALPDHLNYFNFRSLERTLLRHDFHKVAATTVFPMEFFLLSGTDYVAEPPLGKKAHAQRLEFEATLRKHGSDGTLRRFYDQLAAGGFGREILMVAERR